MRISIIATLVLLLTFASKLVYAQEGAFIRLKDMDSQFSYDMRYATKNNFLKKKVYDCADCVIRTPVATALVEANAYFMKLGYRIRLFDCYRPLDVQKAMWKIFPKPGYVADPKKGSVHNKGAAVDLTLETLAGMPLNMGTDFDHFGVEAHHAYQQLPQEVLENRQLLKKGMEAHGFHAIRTEWWHYNFGKSGKYPVSNFKVTCSQ